MVGCKKFWIVSGGFGWVRVASDGFGWFTVLVVTESTNPFLYFNRTPVMCCSYQKHLGVYLHKKLSFHQHIKEIITKASKGIGVIKKLNNVLPRKALLTIYKSFVRPHLDYGDILYHQPYDDDDEQFLWHG